jgi:hypothetical protein
MKNPAIKKNNNNNNNNNILEKKQQHSTDMSVTTNYSFKNITINTMTNQRKD